MVHYKLYYFPIKARGEPIRLIFHYAGVQFEDFRIPPAEWPNYKPSLAGTGDWEKAQVDALIDFIKDIMTEMGPFLGIVLGVAQGDKDAAYKDHYLPTVERVFPVLKKYLRDAGNGFFFKSGVTYVDFVLAELFEMIAQGVPNLYDEHPEFKNQTQKVCALPQLQKYLSARA